MNRKQLDKLHELSDGIKKQNDEASELLRVAQDRHGDRTHKLTRDGKEVEVKEKTLWDEVWHLGTVCEAANVLRKEHPEVFEAYTKAAALSAELERYCMAEFGLNFKAMSLSDYLRMTESLYGLLMTESVTRKTVRIIGRIADKIVSIFGGSATRRG